MRGRIDLDRQSAIPDEGRTTMGHTLLFLLSLVLRIFTVRIRASMFCRMKRVHACTYVRYCNISSNPTQITNKVQYVYYLLDFLCRDIECVVMDEYITATAKPICKGQDTLPFACQTAG